MARLETRIAGFMCGCERAPTTGTPHLQGYMELSAAHTLSAILKWPMFDAELALHHSLRLSVAKGTADHNRTYIFGPYTKPDGTEKECDDFPISFGLFSKSRAGQGKRSDWHTVHELVQRQASTREIVEAVPHLGYAHHHKIDAWRQLWVDVPTQRLWKTRCIIALGPPRAGKSTWMRKRAASEAAQYGQIPYEKADADKWWPSYFGHQVVTIDECHGGYFQWHQLLKTVEEGSLDVQYKGGSTPFVARTIYMTCNDHPAFWYKDHIQWDDTNAFRARIKEFGELWLFNSPTRSEGFDHNTGQVVFGPLQYHDPVRDLELAPPLPKAVQAELGLSQAPPLLPPRRGAKKSKTEQLAELMQSMMQDIVKQNKHFK